MPNPDDPFGDDEDHEKLAALAKSFEEKYVSYFTRLQMDKLMCIYIKLPTGISLDLKKINLSLI